MAKRSDFAQKLLDDLRLRKERMAASQNTKGSNAMVAGQPINHQGNQRQSKLVVLELEAHKTGLAEARNHSPLGRHQIRLFLLVEAIRLNKWEICQWP